MMQEATQSGGMDAGIGGEAAERSRPERSRAAGAGAGAGAWRPEPRLRRADRAQMLMQALVIDELLAADHPARMIEAAGGPGQ